eukprot:403338867
MRGILLSSIKFRVSKLPQECQRQNQEIKLILILTSLIPLNCMRSNRTSAGLDNKTQQNSKYGTALKKQQSPNLKVQHKFQTTINTPQNFGSVRASKLNSPKGEQLPSVVQRLLEDEKKRKEKQIEVDQYKQRMKEQEETTSIQKSRNYKNVHQMSNNSSFASFIKGQEQWQSQRDLKIHSMVQDKVQTEMAFQTLQLQAQKYKSPYKQKSSQENNSIYESTQTQPRHDRLYSLHSQQLKKIEEKRIQEEKQVKKQSTQRHLPSEDVSNDQIVDRLYYSQTTLLKQKRQDSLQRQRSIEKSKSSVTHTNNKSQKILEQNIRDDFEKYMSNNKLEINSKIGISHLWEALKYLGFIQTQSRTNLDRDAYNELLQILKKYQTANEEENNVNQSYGLENQYIPIQLLKEALWCILNLESPSSDNSQLTKADEKLLRTNFIRYSQNRAEFIKKKRDESRVQSENRKMPVMQNFTPQLNGKSMMLVDKILDERLKENGGNYTSYLVNFAKKYQQNRLSMAQQQEQERQQEQSQLFKPKINTKYKPTSQRNFENSQDQSDMNMSRWDMLYTIAKERPKRSDKPQQQVEFEKQQEQCTFQPNKSTIKVNKSQFVSQRDPTQRQPLYKAPEKKQVVPVQVPKKKVEEYKKVKRSPRLKKYGTAELVKAKKVIVETQLVKIQNEPDMDLPEDEYEDANALFFMDINIGNNQKERLIIRKDDVPEIVATDFCKRNNMSEQNQKKLLEAIKAIIDKKEEMDGQFN